MFRNGLTGRDKGLNWMVDDWLLDVLQGIEHYAVLRKISRFMLYAKHDHSTALRELRTGVESPPLPHFAAASLDVAAGRGDEGVGRDAVLALGRHLAFRLAGDF